MSYSEGGESENIQFMRLVNHSCDYKQTGNKHVQQATPYHMPTSPTPDASVRTLIFLQWSAQKSRFPNPRHLFFTPSTNSLNSGVITTLIRVQGSRILPHLKKGETWFWFCFSNYQPHHLTHPHDGKRKMGEQIRLWMTWIWNDMET